MSQTQSPPHLPSGEPPQHTAVLILAWLWVAVPFSYGGWQLLVKVSQLFGG